MPRTAGAWVIVVALAILFAYNVRQHRFLGDDAFISFRYAKHLASGEGLTWNPGERVEGYTNFLWVVLMAGAMRLGIQPEVLAPTLGIATGSLVLGGLVVFTARLSPSAGLLALVPTACLASSRTFTAWCTGGLETMLFTFLVCSAAWAAIEERRREARIRVASAALFAAAALTRPEGLLFGGVCGAWILVTLVWDRRSAAPFLFWLAIFGGITGAHLLWRHEYYGAWVPNTFTAKVPAPWWDHGLKYAWLFTRAYGLPLFAPVVAVVLLKQPDRDRSLIAATILTYATYVVAVGGDRFEFRFWIPVLPFSYWLVVDSVRRLQLSPWAGSAIVLVLLALTLHGSLERHDAQLPRVRGVASVAAIRAYAARRITEGRTLRRLIDAGDLDRGLVLGVTGAGAVPYYTDWPTVDSHGLNDRYIANLPLPKRGVIGHERRAPLAYLRGRGVVFFDALNQLVHRSDRTPHLPSHIVYDGESLAVRILQSGDVAVAFVSLVPEEELRRRFRNLSLIR
jgi:arabinofuranosyltransferase